MIRFEGVEDGYRITVPISGRIVREREFAGAVVLSNDVTVNFFPWGAADASTLDLDNGSQMKQIQVLPTGIVEVN